MTRCLLLAAGAGLMVLAGCSTGAPPVKAGATPYAQEQRAKALKRAAAYCRAKGLSMRASAVGDAPTRSGEAASEVQFRCVKSG